MRIPTYLSHSYRKWDQRVNRAFWHLFSEEGFFFDVDPPSNVTIHAHLERMMRRSSCFVAIVNQRLEAGEPFCSRFILYEYGLALQARVPRLILIDNRITEEGGPFERLEAHEKHFFSHREPLAARDELVELVKGLKKRRLSVRPPRRRPLGLIIPTKGRESALRRRDIRVRIEAVARKFGFRVKELQVPFEQNADMALTLESCEALVLDVSGRELPPWMFAYIHGRLLPSIKLAQVSRGRTIRQLRLPPLVEGLRMDPREPAVESVTYWREADDLVYQLGQAFRKLNEEPTRLHSRYEGDLYFQSIGRRPARIFISNSGEDKQLASRLSEILRLHSIDHFHYKKEDDEKGEDIETGSEWEEKIRHELQACQVFVALMGPTYSIKEWCVEELRVALERKTSDRLGVLLYKVGSEKVPLPDLESLRPLQVTDRLEHEKIAAVKIFRAIDRYLKKEDEGAWQPRQPLLLGGSHELLVDELRQLSRDSWTALLDGLRDAGVKIRPLPADPSPRSRLVADELISEVQRALPSPKPAAASASTLAQLAEGLASLVPRGRRAPLREIARRLRDSADAGG